ncbi:MAG TPA: DUF2155 domain-containing protein [Rhizomicrobium sp.]|nr:DUF2155 domain-containing protein [Rhizomicrobium sp.]
MKRCLRQSALALLSLGFVAAALAQGQTPAKVTPAAPALKPAIPSPPAPVAGPAMVQPAAPAAVAPANPALAQDSTPATPLAPPQGGTQLLLRGLEKITGRPTNITAPVGKPVHFATLTITARYCYSTPASETPETAAFVQIEDHRPDQQARRVFSGWMYGSTPGLNGVEHPLYDVWVISCNNAPAQAVASNTSTAAVKVAAPDSSDKEGIQALPEGAGQ